MSPAILSSITTTEVPVVSGDILRSIATPVVLPTASTASKRRGSVAETVGVDLNAIGKVEARKIMSEEHRILGFRPPHDSLAAEAQAAAAKHPEGNPEKQPPDPLKLKELARQDALRILSERETNIDSSSTVASGSGKSPKSSLPPTGGVNLATISASEARSLMSHEHRALGFRPPPGSLAAEAQAAAARHPDGAGMATVDAEILKEIAMRDAERIKADRELNIVGEVNVSTIGIVGAERLAQATERVLGHTPPPGSMAAEAKQAAAVHPKGGSFPAMGGDVEQLEEVGCREGERLKAQENKDRKVEAEEVRIEDVGEVVDGSSSLILGTTTEEVGLANLEHLAVKNGMGRVLQEAVVRSDSTGDSVEIVGDVVSG
ncbi:uncharacterized protein FIBRA_03017 [Fibroporia radiculosa]|uniref:SMP domain-containing protein n=1 Tax=Fibroporia radiculosa TaxID=599839 RepID=J4H262_9APHY|nr:uncharacterized protein FIBRA_03017 [Fibroporia radiculosa]CCM00969.1 predicted protein [Fibroporia radiculosa]